MQFDTDTDDEEREDDVASDVATDDQVATDDTHTEKEEITGEEREEAEHYDTLVSHDRGQLSRDLDAMRVKEEESLVERGAERLGVQYADLDLIPIETDALRLIPEQEARTGNVAA